MDNDYQEIRIDQIPDAGRWWFTPLYKSDALEGMRFWQVGFDGENLVTRYGRVNGAVQTSSVVVELNNSGRSLLDQALLETRNRYRIKYREGYRPPGSTDKPFLNAMKGPEYTHKKIKVWPVYVQPKLDGIRMLTYVDMGMIHMRSFNNTSFTNMQHLHTDLLEFFQYLPTGSTLDGELYNHLMSFQEITSAVKTVKKIHQDINKIQYWIYDIIYIDHNDGNSYDKRYELLVSAFYRFVEGRNPDGTFDAKYMPTTFTILQADIAGRAEDVDAFLQKYMEQGYEGVMVKKIAHPDHPIGSKHHMETLYKSGRSSHILKYKMFRDEEGVITGYKEGKGKDEGTIIFTVRDPRGNSFDVRLKGKYEYRADLFKRGEQLIGLPLTYKFQELTTGGVPRFPVGIAIRDYE